MDKDRKRGVRRERTRTVRLRAIRKVKKTEEQELISFSHSRYLHFTAFKYDEVFQRSRRRDYYRNEGKYILSRAYRNWEFDWEGYSCLLKFKKRIESMTQELEDYTNGNDPGYLVEYRRCWLQCGYLNASYSL